MSDSNGKFQNGPSRHGPSKDEPAEPAGQTISHDGKPVYSVEMAPSDALVIHCADPRFQVAFRRFVTEELGLANYTPIVIGGGIHALSSQTFLPKNFKILWEQVKFYVKEGSIRRIIFINHEDCKWYEKMHGHFPRLNMPAKARDDLAMAAQIILNDFTGVHLETYFAHLSGNEITFERVT